MRRLAISATLGVLGAVERLYGRRAGAVDLALGLIAAAWLALEIAKPEIFDRRGYSGMAWLPDAAWEVFFCLVTLLHLVGLARPYATGVRTLAAALSAWVWLFVSGSLARVELTTGVCVYAVIGVHALGAAIYVSSLRPVEG